MFPSTEYWNPVWCLPAIQQHFRRNISTHIGIPSTSNQPRNTSKLCFHSLWSPIVYAQSMKITKKKTFFRTKKIPKKQLPCGDSPWLIFRWLESPWILQKIHSHHVRFTLAAIGCLFHNSHLGMVGISHGTQWKNLWRSGAPFLVV